VALHVSLLGGFGMICQLYVASCATAHIRENNTIALSDALLLLEYAAVPIIHSSTEKLQKNHFSLLEQTLLMV